MGPEDRESSRQTSSGEDQVPAAEPDADIETSGREADVDALVSVDELRTAAGSLKDELTDAQKARDESIDQAQRVQAEFQNYKKRMMREQTELVDRASQRLVEALLPVLESLDLAADSVQNGDNSGEAAAAGGLTAVRTQINDILEKEGLEKIAPEAGAGVDPEIHEAVVRATDQDGGGADGETGADVVGPTVTKVLRPGYRLKGKLLRPAMVEFTD